MIKIEVTGESLPEVADKLLALGRSLSQQDPVMSEVKAAVKRTKKETVTEVGEIAASKDTEAEQAPATTEVSESSAGSTGQTAQPDASPSKVLDFDKDVAPVVISFVQSKGKPYVIGILEQFGVAKASDLPEARWGELLTALAG